MILFKQTKLPKEEKFERERFRDLQMGRKPIKNVFFVHYLHIFAKQISKL
jgi:hypothetical protein